MPLNISTQHGSTAPWILFKMEDRRGEGSESMSRIKSFKIATNKRGH